MDEEKVILFEKPFVTTTHNPERVILEHQKFFYSQPTDSGKMWEQTGEPIIEEIGAVNGLKQYRVTIPERQYEIRGRSR